MSKAYKNCSFDIIKQNNKQEIAIDRKLGTERVKKLVVLYSLTTFIGLFAQCIGVVGDGFIVGNGIGSSAFAVVSIIYPFWTLVVAIAVLIGSGATAIVAKKIGEGEIEEARSLFGQAVWYSILLSSVISVLVLFNLETILHFMGATGNVLHSAKIYTKIFMLGFPFCVTGAGILIYGARIDEKPKMAMVAYVLPVPIALAVEYYLIFEKNMGIAGSAWAYIILTGSLMLLIFHFTHGKTILRLKMSDIKLDFRKVHEINKVGFASFAIQITFSIITVIINNLLGKYGGEIDIAAYGVINAYFLYFFSLMALSFVLAIQPIVSYNYGAKLYSRVRETLKYGMKYAFVSLFIIVAFLLIYNEKVLELFCGGDQLLVETTKTAMRIFLFLFPLGAVTMLVSGYFQAIEHNGKAVFNGISRTFIFAIPFVYVLPKFLGLKGIWMYQPVVEVISVIAAMYFISKELKRLKKLEKEKQLEMENRVAI